MLWTLFCKECRQLTKCLTYYVVVICIVGMYVSQLGSDSNISKPKPGQESYGFTLSQEPEVIMKSITLDLAREYNSNSYTSYQFILYKKVVLSQKQQAQMRMILSDITGIKGNRLDEYIDNFFENTAPVIYGKGKNNTVEYSKKDTVTEAAEDTETLSPAVGLTYEQFTALMKKADKLLGGGSNYSFDHFKNGVYVTRTYEQAVKEYHDIIKKDHLLGAYARLFCDYLGVILALIPVFLAVTRVIRDRRAKAEEIIYSRSASSASIVVSRYLAMVLMLLVPVILLSVFMELDGISAASRENITVDYFIFIKYILAWLLPTVMVTVSLGMLITELTASPVAIIVQGLWWLTSLTSGELVGNCGWNLIPRHNRTGYYDIFKENLGQFISNRVAYTLAAGILLLLTVYVYEMKRKGRYQLRGTVLSNRKIKSKA